MLRRRGWHTIAQNEASCVVFSMPKAAIDAGAACEVLPIDQMPRVVAARFSA
jgi:two-component system response regulator WspF